jgi:hypothetical protein
MRRARVRSLGIAVALSLPAASASRAAPIDFTPIQVRTVEDGIPAVRTAFKDGNKKIFFRAAKGWRMAGGGQELRLYPTEHLDGYVRIGNSPVEASVLFEEAGIPTYEATARSVLPQAAVNIEVLSRKGDAYPLDDWKSYEIHFAYELNGTANRCWVLFITMNPQRQIWYVVDARQRDFDAVYAAARSMLGSWFEPPPGWPPPLTRSSG